MHQTPITPEEEGNFLGLMFMIACPFKAASTDKCVLISSAQTKKIHHTCRSKPFVPTHELI